MILVEMDVKTGFKKKSNTFYYKICLTGQKEIKLVRIIMSCSAETGTMIKATQGTRPIWWLCGRMSPSGV